MVTNSSLLPIFLHPICSSCPLKTCIGPENSGDLPPWRKTLCARRKKGNESPAGQIGATEFFLRNASDLLIRRRSWPEVGEGTRGMRSIHRPASVRPRLRRSRSAALRLVPVTRFICRPCRQTGSATPNWTPWKARSSRGWTPRSTGRLVEAIGNRRKRDPHLANGVNDAR